MNTEQAREVADVCRMLADGTRVQMLVHLAEGPQSVGMLCDSLTLSQPTASHHLALLRMTGLVHRQRKGKQMFYSLNKKRIAAVGKFVGALK
jgi:DNA-binding transcriptional ArsR family regulator